MPTLHLTVFWCTDADRGLFRTPGIFTACRAIAKNYNLDLETVPQSVRDPRFVLNFSGDIIGPREWALGLQSMFDAANQRVRGLADQAFQGGGRLPVIFGTLNNGVDGIYCGQTIMTVSNQDKTSKSDWPAYCIVDPVSAFDRPHSMLHEIAHAAGAVHNLSVRGGFHDLMIDGDITPTITIEPRVVDLLTKSYFCW